MDLNREDYATDCTTPIIYDVEVITQKTSKPGTVKVNLNADGTGSPLGVLEIQAEEKAPSNVGDYMDWMPNYFYDIKAKNFEKEKFNGVAEALLDGEGAIEVINNGTVFETKRIWLRDAAGNMIMFNMNFKEHGLVTVDEEFDFVFTGALSNPNVPMAIESMDEGQAVALNLNDKSKGIISKEILNAIAGKDKTVVVYVNSNRSLQWVFYGKDIQQPVKALDLNVTLKGIDGEKYGTKGTVIRLDFANNGNLPGKAHFRLKSGYIKSIYKLSDNLHIYYQGNKGLVTKESSDCKVVKNGNDYWCYLDLKHNSTFILSATALKNTVKGKTVVFSPKSYTYSGKYVKPSITVKNDKTTLVKNTDYTYTVAKGKNVGKYVATIKGKGKYTGTTTAYYKINPKGTSLKSVKKGKKQFTAKWKKQSTQTTGYQIRYSRYSSMKDAKTITVSGAKKTSVTVKKLKAKTKYYVQVRTYKTVKKEKFYSGWSKAKTVKTK
ncbi:MAG: fibronectin type III domain-containing protein, partial [Firmicutes bacterium]|nr:fibronectin type III domain-containing protein [Bacillota bacterium]